MIFAKSETGLIRASKDAAGYCPGCGEKLIPKCGEINIHHWAHKGSDCDSWSEGETEWHLSWKNLAKEVEVRVGPHRADIWSRPFFIELQNSHISPEEIRDREEFYGPMLWLFNGIEFENRFHLNAFVNKKGETNFGFYWEHPRKSVLTCTRPIFIDLGMDRVFEIVHKNLDKPSGWGYLWPKSKFIEMYIK